MIDGWHWLVIGRLAGPRYFDVSISANNTNTKTLADFCCFQSTDKTVQYMCWCVGVILWSRSEWPPHGCLYRWLIRLAFDTPPPLSTLHSTSISLPSIPVSFLFHPCDAPPAAHISHHRSSRTGQRERGVQHIAPWKLQINIYLLKRKRK